MLTNFPNGLTSFGIPLVGGVVPGIPAANSTVRWVGTAAQTAGLDNRYSTIQGALNASSDGDIIFVFPGTYAENLTVSDNYIQLIGAQWAGYARPDVTGTGVKLTVTGQGFYCSHMRFTSSDSDCVVQNGNGFAYVDNVFDGSVGQAATEACLRLVGLSNDSFTASEGKIYGNLFRGSTSGAGLMIQHAPLLSGVGCSDNEIVANRFYANGVDVATSANVSGGGAGICLTTLIHGNFFMTSGAAYVYVNFAAGTAGDRTANSGIISGNFFADDALIAAQINIASNPNVYFAGNFDAAGVINGSTFNN